MKTTFGTLFLLRIVILTTTDPNDKNIPAPKWKHNERNNILFPPIGPPNIQSSSGTPLQTSPKALPSSEYPNAGVGARKPMLPSEYAYRSSGKIDDKNYCDFAQPDVQCSNLDGDCLECNFDIVKHTCIYGKNVTVSCTPKEIVLCQGERRFQKEIVCQYCYQSPIWKQRCNGMAMCNSIGAPRFYFRGNCTVVPELLCLGSRRFHRMIPCNWKNGHRWSTTMLLSITLGGFGADRFYLGRWQEGIGKLFSFGGLGVWTLVDICLIAVRYLGPADGSIYVD